MTDYLRHPNEAYELLRQVAKCRPDFPADESRLLDDLCDYALDRNGWVDPPRNSPEWERWVRYCLAEKLIEPRPDSPLRIDDHISNWMNSADISDTWENRLTHARAAMEAYGGAFYCTLRLTDPLGMVTLEMWTDAQRQHKPAGDGSPAEPLSGKPGEISPKIASPRMPLTGWLDIASAVGMGKSDIEQVKALNRQFDGPIRVGRKGAKPLVYKDELIQWWDNMTVQAQAVTDKAKGRVASGEAQHAYGRTGTAAPEVGGGVKRRRRNRT